VCRFVDPIADIAVFGSPDNPHADEYKALMETATSLSIGGTLRHPVNFWVPARLLSLDGRRWFSCTVRHFGGPLWITHAAEGIRSEISGSPIVREIGTAIGVVCIAAAPWEGGPNPRPPTTCRDGCCATPSNQAQKPSPFVSASRRRLTRQARSRRGLGRVHLPQSWPRRNAGAGRGSTRSSLPVGDVPQRRFTSRKTNRSYSDGADARPKHCRRGTAS
jgi:hypothetical protein